MTVQEYTPRDFSYLPGLNGISDGQTKLHLDLYQGYIDNVNKLNALLAETDPKSAQFAEMTRRLGFEYNGMILHEYFFSNLSPRPHEMPLQLRAILTASGFDGSQQWLDHLKTLASMRGIGWVIAFQEPRTERIVNMWVGEHQNGIPAGYQPIYVIDLWEHARLLDYGTDVAAYTEAVIANTDWDTVTARLI